MKTKRAPSLPDVPVAAPPSSRRACLFPIVGIGASAGGLEALEQFLAGVPVKSGLAFVIVQHLDPTRQGLMPELLQRATPMPVMQVQDATRVRPDRVYVIPPNRDMSVLHGTLHLFEPAEPRGLRLPIDFFLRSLAQDQQEGAIGVILSGMGSDGVLGLRAIKEHAGVVLVQEPASAKFDGMPRSAIDAGLADIVAPAGELAARILAFRHRAAPPAGVAPATADRLAGSVEKAVILLRAHTGHDFSLYKRNTLHRRIERRMGIHQLADPAHYVRYLQENSQELDLLFKELLIGVTAFFRDPAAWEQLRTDVFPGFFARRPAGQTLRAWVAGCSTGEEAYSLAMVFKEAVDQAAPRSPFNLQIFATDLDDDAIDKARHGVFPANITADVSPARLKRFFAKEDGAYRVRAEIREMVTFAPQNLIMDPPFTKLDFISCRNLLIYLGPEVQKKLIPLFHYSLNPGGTLLLGSAETVGDGSDLFRAVPGKPRLFQRTETAGPVSAIEFPAAFNSAPVHAPDAPPDPKPRATLQSQADQLVLRRYAPAAVLVNDRGDILYVSGHTGPYLEPAAGKANWNLFAMAREHLRYELAGAFQKALRLKTKVSLHRLRVPGAKGGDRTVDLSVERISEPGLLDKLVMVVFAEGPGLPPARTSRRAAVVAAPQSRVAVLEQELAQVRTDARLATEEMQTSQEELRSANEELQSTIEELQSTNEELTTSKEEMQSLNEELQTLNNELQASVEGHTQSNNDMANLLNSTDIATLFLDHDLRVRRFTPQAARIIKLIPGDIGRPVTDLVSDLNHPSLPADVRTVLRRTKTVTKTARTHDGRWFTLRIMPYRVDERVEGVVITFADITVAKTLEAKLRHRHARLARAMATRARRQSPARPRKS